MSRYAGNKLYNARRTARIDYFGMMQQTYALHGSGAYLAMLVTSRHIDPDNDVYPGGSNAIWMAERQIPTLNSGTLETIQEAGRVMAYLLPNLSVPKPPPRLHAWRAELTYEERCSQTVWASFFRGASHSFERLTGVDLDRELALHNLLVQQVIAPLHNYIVNGKIAKLRSFRRDPFMGTLENWSRSAKDLGQQGFLLGQELDARLLTLHHELPKGGDWTEATRADPEVRQRALKLRSWLKKFLRWELTVPGMWDSPLRKVREELSPIEYGLVSESFEEQLRLTLETFHYEPVALPAPEVPATVAA